MNQKTLQALLDGRIHYHIRWSGEGALDWERFDTSAEAKKSANLLALPGESYAIEEHGEACPRCMDVMKKILARDTSNEVSL